MRLLTLAALAALVVGCSGRTSQSELMARQLMTVWESGNTAALDEIMAEDVVYDDMPDGERHEGIEAVRGYFEHVHSWAGEVQMELTRIQAAPNLAVAKWIMRGVQDRPIPRRIPIATNRRYALEGATIIELRDGKIIRAADYIHVLDFLVQLGARVELPGASQEAETQQPDEVDADSASGSLE